MSRYIPLPLKEHLRSGARTVCWILRISPVTPGHSDYGMAELDDDVFYDDGDGLLKYSGVSGFESSTLVGTAELTSDSSEAKGLLPAYDIPVTEESLRAGAYDFANYWLYLVNYNDLTMGHVTLQRGTIGQVSIRDSGLSFINELRPLAAKLKQSVCEKDSLTCRAVFGSQPPGSTVPGPQVDRGWCGYPAESLLVGGTVIEAGLEPHTLFKVGPFVEAAGALAPGMLRFLTGRNAGREIEITDNDSEGWITVAYDLPYPVDVDDEVEYRVDCTKHARDDNKGCRHHFESEWVLHFRGEPDIPIGDEGAMSVPGAGVGAGDGGYTQIPYDESQQ